jgi:protein-S-isoprenylcysteine O-methyltransferase Ste14
VGPWHDAFLRLLHPALWLAWIAYWIISARGLKRVVRREKPGQRLLYTLPLVIGASLLAAARHFLFLPRPLPMSYTLYWSGTALLVAGLVFAIWARITLGANWSGTVTVKENHELIQTGPYHLVRHPIYTGLLLALLGSALAQDLWTSLAAVALFFFSFWIKLLREEQFMRETFGEKYAAYCARTKRLVPFLL